MNTLEFIRQTKSIQEFSEKDCYSFLQRTRHCHKYDKESAGKNERQVAVHPILSMLSEILPDDAFCMCCVTMEDLFDGKSDSFVGGMAAGGSHVGVFSMCRYDPDFRKIKKKRKKDTKQSGELLTEGQLTLLQRGCKVIVHEIGHMFNIGHCIYFSCCMNGSGHLEEDYRQPIHLCPVDLHKMQVATGCDIWQRYHRLLQFYEKFGMLAEAEWIRKRFAQANIIIEGDIVITAIQEL